MAAAQRAAATNGPGPDPDPGPGPSSEHYSGHFFQGAGSGPKSANKHGHRVFFSSKALRIRKEYIGNL